MHAPVHACFWCKKSEFWQSILEGTTDIIRCTNCKPDCLNWTNGRIVTATLPVGYGTPLYAKNLIPPFAEKKIPVVNSFAEAMKGFAEVGSRQGQVEEKKPVASQPAPAGGLRAEAAKFRRPGKQAS